MGCVLQPNRLSTAINCESRFPGNSAERTDRHSLITDLLTGFRLSSNVSTRLESGTST